MKTKIIIWYYSINYSQTPESKVRRRVSRKSVQREVSLVCRGHFLKQKNIFELVLLFFCFTLFPVYLTRLSRNSWINLERPYYKKTTLVVVLFISKQLQTYLNMSPSVNKRCINCWLKWPALKKLLWKFIVDKSPTLVSKCQEKCQTPLVCVNLHKKLAIQLNRQFFILMVYFVNNL